MVQKYLSIAIDIRPTHYGCSYFHPTVGSDTFTFSILATPVPTHDTTRESLSNSHQNLKVTLLHSTLGRYFPLLPPSPGIFEVYHMPSRDQAHGPLSSGQVLGLLCSSSEPFYVFSDPSIACTCAFLSTNPFLRGPTLLQFSPSA
jgi:hypothetical protein